MNNTCFNNVDFTCFITENFKNVNESQAMQLLQANYSINSIHPMYVFDYFDDDRCFTESPSTQCSRNAGEILIFLALVVFFFWAICELVVFCGAHNRQKGYIPLTSTKLGSPNKNDINF